MSFFHSSLWRAAVVIGIVERAAAQSEQRAGDMILKAANETVPYDTGELMKTGKSEDGFVSYDTPYAVRLHENPQYDFQGSGRGKWLERTLEEKARDVPAEMAEPLRDAMRGL